MEEEAYKKKKLLDIVNDIEFIYFHYKDLTDTQKHCLWAADILVKKVVEGL